MTAFEKWELPLQQRLPLDAIWLTKAHPNFYYPEFFKLDPGPDPLRLAKELIDARHTERIKLFDGKKTAIATWLKSLQLSSGSTTPTIASLGPAGLSFTEAALELGFKIKTLSVDPEELRTMDGPWLDVRAVIMSQPHSVLGSYYPQELFDLVVGQIVSRNLPLLVDESATVFCWNTVAPGTAQPWLESKHAVSKLASLYPVMAPHGPDLAWIMSGKSAAPLPGAELIATETLLPALSILGGFASRQGGALSEFQRSILAVHQSLRLFTDELKPLLNAKKLAIKVWPEAGFSLLLTRQESSSKSPVESAEEWTATFAQKSGVVMIPGPLIGAGRLDLGVCTAQPEKVLRTAAQRLSEVEW